MTLGKSRNSSDPHFLTSKMGLQVSKLAKRKLQITLTKPLTQLVTALEKALYWQVAPPQPGLRSRKAKEPRLAPPSQG